MPREQGPVDNIVWDYMAQADLWETKYRNLQAEIDEHDRKALRKYSNNPSMAALKLGEHSLYMSKCAERDRCIQLAIMYATMAAAYKQVA